MKRIAPVVVWLLVSHVAWGAFKTPPYRPAAVQAKLPAYRVKADLSNIVNRKQFGRFTPDQRALLAKQGFFVAPAQNQQLYTVYERNDYLVIPNFITSDAVLQLYHIFYDYSLREVEAERLIPLAKRLTSHLLAQSLSTYRHLPEGSVREAARRNTAYFGVAAKALDLKAELPAEAAKLVDAEWGQIEAHVGRRKSAIFPYSIDYSQFVPRGHCTRSETLKRYFKTMMWYGLVPFALEWPERQSPPRIDFPQIRQSLLITRALYETQLDGKPALDAWNRIYEPTAFYVELSDDLTPTEWREAALTVWGHLPNPSELADESKLAAFHDQAMQIRAPRIATFYGEPAPEQNILDIPTGPQFRVMGQRTVPDSYLLQQLVWSNVGTLEKKRLMPKGLDVFSALGSKRAASHLQKMGETKYAHYEERMARLQTEFAKKTEEDWRRNLYWGWLWALKGLAAPAGAGCPSFMQTAAWQDKQLTAVLASWAELRHDTLLYAKESMAAEGGDQEPPAPKAYVEPVPELYARLLWLTRATRQGLRERQLQTASLDESFGDFEDLLLFLQHASVVELSKGLLTPAEYTRMQGLGAELEHLTKAVSTAIGGTEGELTTEADENMALVADVHTALPNCLEEGVGHANEIYVVVPIEGKLYLTRGAVFSYYEFEQPVRDRLTDEAWQARLTKQQAPAPPAWTASYLAKPKSELPVPRSPWWSRGG